MEFINSNFIPDNDENHSSNPLLHSNVLSTTFDDTRSENYKTKLSRFIRKLNKLLKFSDENLNCDLVEKIQRSGICFNSIIFNSEDSRKGDISPGPNSFSKILLSRISDFSGGRSFFTNDIERAVKGIKDHKFAFYNLDFSLLSKDKSLKIELESKGTLLTGFGYPKILDNNYVKQVRKNSSMRRRLISQFDVINNI